MAVLKKPALRLASDPTGAMLRARHAGLQLIHVGRKLTEELHMAMIIIRAHDACCKP